MQARKERKDALEHKRAILHNAQVLFEKHGVDCVNMHQIAKSAGIGQATLYRRYAHKGEICLDLMQESSSQLCEGIGLFLIENTGKPVRERLENVLNLMLDFMDDQFSWLSSIQAPTCEGRRSIIYHTPLYETLHNVLCQLLDEIMPNSNRAVKLDSKFMADAVLASMAPDLYAFQRQDRGLSKAEILQQIQCLYVQPLFS